MRRCAESGVAVTPLILPESVDPDTALDRFQSALSSHPDAVFVQVPFPPGFDGGALIDAIPPVADIDVMSPAAIERYELDATAAPPLTVAAALALLDHHGVSVSGLEGVVVGPASAFHDQFARALARRGAVMRPRLDPGDPGLAAGLATSGPEAGLPSAGLKAGLATAGLVVVAAADPGLVPAGWIRPGAVVIDAGYYNPGGVGDLALDDGTDHLGALSPVPGGVGPMTVSMLVEAVVARAEDRD